MASTLKHNNHCLTNPNTSQLTLAIAAVLAAPVYGQADTYHVTQNSDDGTGLVANTLSWAILQANTNPGADVIELNTDVTITGVMKRIFDSNVTMTSDGTRRNIDGNGQFRPLFIKSGLVTIENLNVSNGLAQGGATGNGGAGAGLGGGLFIYGGQVRLTEMVFNNNTSIGGNTNLPDKFGGGGMFGSANFYGGGGLFGDAIGNFVNGGYGGYGNYQTPQAPNFGEGGGYIATYIQAMGGFGGGGAYSYDHFGAPGGFGGGGGYAYNEYAPQFFGGDGGFGAGGGLNRYSSSNDGVAGFGGQGQQAAGLGGALFIRSGQLLMEDVTFNNNSAQNQSGAEGLGGGLFIQHLTTQANGNNQGMPDQLADVFGCSVDFVGNQAATDPNSAANNDAFFDVANRRLGLSGSSINDICLYDQEIQVQGNGIEIVSADTTPSTTDGTDFGSVTANYTTKSNTFHINNLGSTTLILTGQERVELLNSATSRFAVAQEPVSTIIPGNHSLSFRIAFTPMNLISYTDTVVIRSSDLDEPIYTFDISGQGIPFTDLIFSGDFE